MIARSIILFLALLPVTVYAGEGQRLLDKFLSDTDTMSASFKQVLLSEDGFVLQESSGRFYLDRPGRFRWDYAEPYEQQVISDGDNIYIYDVDLEQVTVRSQQQGTTNTPMALMQGKVQLAESFDIAELDSRDGIYRVRLHSKTDDAEFDGVIVGVDDQGLRFLQLVDRFMQKTEIVFDELQSNIDIDSSRFEFTPPDGVDVFDGG